MKNVMEVIQDRLQYKNLNQDEKINYIKSKFNLTHGKGKKKGRKKKNG